MDLERLRKHQKALARSGVRFVDGLTAAELSDLEVRYGFSFPTDLRTFLMFALPVSDRFVDWRNATTEQVNDSLRWPLDGICFDIEHNDFWPNDWGTRPDALPQAFAIAAQRVQAAPTLIPICGHRYIPDRPCEVGNPVFSVYQSDIIVYGYNLDDYLQNEFSYSLGGRSRSANGQPKEIEFWTSVVQ